jgi:malonyl-CoA O-methyltransferase
LEILKQNSDIKKIYAIDFSNNMLDIAKKMIKSKKVEFICSDVKNIDKFINEKADIIVCNSAFWQFDDKNLIINKIHSLLKNG